jgi:hypothetical protein
VAEHRWGSQPVQLYLGVSIHAATEVSIPRSIPARLSVVAIDHVVTVAQHPISPRPAGATRPSTPECVGPVPMSGLAQAYDAALLLLRLIRAGVATPPSPVMIHAPNLVFLRPSPSEASVQRPAAPP